MPDIRACSKKLEVSFRAFVRPGRPLPGCVRPGAAVQTPQRFSTLQRLHFGVACRRSPCVVSAAGSVWPGYVGWRRGRRILNYQFSTAQTEQGPRRVRGSPTRLLCQRRLGPGRLALGLQFLGTSGQPGRASGNAATATRNGTSPASGRVCRWGGVKASRLGAILDERAPFCGGATGVRIWACCRSSMQGYAPLSGHRRDLPKIKSQRGRGFTVHPLMFAPGTIEINGLNAAGGSGEMGR